MSIHIRPQDSPLLTHFEKVKSIHAFVALCLSALVSCSPIAREESARPDLLPRQDIDFLLVDSSPDPTIAPDNSTNYDQQAAISNVVASIDDNPLPQGSTRRKRDMIISTSAGYTDNLQLAGAAINAPLNCNGADTFMGAKLFTSGTFDTTLCATACSAQSAYNVAHPPSRGSPKTCQFYNTYVLYKDNVYQGQYCSMYTQAWDVSFATNKGQWRGTSHYTIDQSYISTNLTNSGDVSCPSDVSYLSTNGAAFCSAYINYQPPVSTVISVSTPVVSVVVSVVTSFTTTTSYGTLVQKSQSTGTVTSAIPNYKRDVLRPASLSTWSPSRILKACSAVATGLTTTSTTTTAATSYSTSTTTALQTIISTISTTTTTTEISTATVAPLNLVRRPGFEGGTGADYYQILPNPGGWQIIKDSSEAHSGDYYLKLGQPSGGGCEVIQTIPTKAALYTAQFWYKYQDVGDHCSLFSSFNGADIYRSKIEGSNPTWTFMSIPNVKGIVGGQNFYVGLDCSSGNGYLDVDDLSFYAQ